MKTNSIAQKFDDVKTQYNKRRKLTADLFYFDRNGT